MFSLDNFYESSRVFDESGDSPSSANNVIVPKQ